MQIFMLLTMKKPTEKKAHITTFLHFIYLCDVFSSQYEMTEYLVHVWTCHAAVVNNLLPSQHF